MPGARPSLGQMTDLYSQCFKIQHLLPLSKPNGLCANKRPQSYLIKRFIGCLLPYWRTPGHRTIAQVGFQSRCSGLSKPRFLFYSAIVCVFWVSRLEFHSLSFGPARQSNKVRGLLTRSSHPRHTVGDFLPRTHRLTRLPLEGFYSDIKVLEEHVLVWRREPSTAAAPVVLGAQISIGRAQGRWRRLTAP